MSLGDVSIDVKTANDMYTCSGECINECGRVLIVGVMVFVLFCFSRMNHLAAPSAVCNWVRAKEVLQYYYPFSGGAQFLSL